MVDWQDSPRGHSTSVGFPLAFLSIRYGPATGRENSCQRLCLTLQVAWHYI